MSTKNIAVIVGSLRKASLTRKFAQAMMTAAPAGLALRIVEIGDLPLYNQDLEDAGAPAAWVAFRDAVRPADGVVFFTPEYNRGLPAAVKNAIDIGSRPYGQAIWSKKPAAIVSVTPGQYGAFGANHQLRQSMVFLDMPCLQQPEMYIGHVGTYMDEAGKINNEKTLELVQRFWSAYEALLQATISS